MSCGETSRETNIHVTGTPNEKNGEGGINIYKAIQTHTFKLIKLKHTKHEENYTKAHHHQTA